MATLREELLKLDQKDLDALAKGVSMDSGADFMAALKSTEPLGITGMEIIFSRLEKLGSIKADKVPADAKDAFEALKDLANKYKSIGEILKFGEGAKVMAEVETIRDLREAAGKTGEDATTLLVSDKMFGEAYKQSVDEARALATKAGGKLGGSAGTSLETLLTTIRTQENLKETFGEALGEDSRDFKRQVKDLARDLKNDSRDVSGEIRDAVAAEKRAMRELKDGYKQAQEQLRDAFFSDGKKMSEAEAKQFERASRALSNKFNNLFDKHKSVLGHIEDAVGTLKEAGVTLKHDFNFDPAEKSAVNKSGSSAAESAAKGAGEDAAKAAEHPAPRSSALGGVLGAAAGVGISEAFLVNKGEEGDNNRVLKDAAGGGIGFFVGRAIQNAMGAAKHIASNAKFSKLSETTAHLHV